MPLALPSTVSSVESGNPLTHFAAHQRAQGEEIPSVKLSFHHHYLNMTLLRHMSEELGEVCLWIWSRLIIIYFHHYVQFGTFESSLVLNHCESSLQLWIETKEHI